jgi:hypothetical protein
MDPLTLEMQKILFKMRWLIPWGATASYSSDGGGVPDSRPPAGVNIKNNCRTELVPFEYWKREWERAVSTSQKERVVSEAKVELEQWEGGEKRALKSRAAVPESTEEFEDRLAAEVNKGWTVNEVALAFHTTPRIVKRAVAASASRQAKPETGDRNEKVLELVARELSERQIAFMTGASRGTIRRAMGKAA